ncbi:hypothetical protein PVAND_017859 [Polypedilum vanderplanki]|uniref:Glutaredoxin domain-containing protein n=1 Tax=Polypedilum vanderplanki TaxID=319348 RepID=A0A9J6B949_POLVA|nr:hypothetical protein PVAND_017859 [Polypedilum vanderplanki]
MSSVSTYPSSDADGSFLSHPRHILKIEISPTTIRKNSNFIASDKKLNQKMSIMSNNKESIYKNVTIIQQQPISDECDFDENLSDDQKLVLNVTCRKNEVIRNCENGSVRLKVMSSGQCSPEYCCGGDDHLDSGTCSDVEVNPLCDQGKLLTTSDSPPPLPPKGLKKKTIKLSESTCSDASSASSSSDSMQYQNQLISPHLIRSINNNKNKSITMINGEESNIISFLPRSLLHDIRTHTMKSFLRNELLSNDDDDEDNEEDSEQNESSAEETNYCDIVTYSSEKNDDKLLSDFYDDDKFYKFHINENSSSIDNEGQNEESDESFAGYKDLLSTTSTIKSEKGTIRGVKNRVRNGIATFLQMQQTTVKNFKEKDGGKIVLYTTSMGIVRSTYAKCKSVKQILRTLMVKFEERDVFMSINYQQEIRDRMQTDDIDVPQLFVDGHYIGNADQVERLNETGELRVMLKSYKSLDSLVTCNICQGYKMLPCPSCCGSKKSIHRNNFTAEFIALKCVNCDEVGLVKCYNCV